MRYGFRFGGRSIGLTALALLSFAAVAVGGRIPPADSGAPPPAPREIEVATVTEPPPEPLLPGLPAQASIGASAGKPAHITAETREQRVARLDVQDNPGSLTSFRNRVGQSIYFRVTGNATAGSVYGSGVYTDDSALAAAVVHDGVLKDGQTGVVQVTILPGQANYDAATRHGISSYRYGQWVGSYRVEKVDRPMTLRLVATSAAVKVDPGNLTGLANQIGESHLFRVTGTTDGSVWGTDEYTSDSDLSTAAVHAGLVDAGETKVIRAAILPGRRHYTGSLRHGIASRDWGNWGSTYRLAPLAGAIPAEDMQEVIDDPGNVTRFHLPVGATLRVRVTGSIDGFIWGNEPYTYDSDLSTAAVHAGVLQVGETGIVKVTIQPVQYGFPGTERNGVTSRDWLPWDGNYRVERDDANEAR